MSRGGCQRVDAIREIDHLFHVVNGKQDHLMQFTHTFSHQSCHSMRAIASDAPNGSSSNMTAASMRKMHNDAAHRRTLPGSVAGSASPNHSSTRRSHRARQDRCHLERTPSLHMSGVELSRPSHRSTRSGAKCRGNIRRCSVVTIRKKVRLREAVTATAADSRSVRNESVERSMNTPALGWPLPTLRQSHL